MSNPRDLMQAGARVVAQRGIQRDMERAARAQAGDTDTTVLLAVDAITIDESIQVRVGGVDQETVEQYMVIMIEHRGWGPFPPVDVHRDGQTLYLSAGFQRFEAARRASEQLVLDGGEAIAEIPARVRPGGREAALEFAEDDNLQHGKPLSMADKLNMFQRRLARGHRWAQMSDRAIARELGVDHKTIGNWRKSSLTGEISPVRENEGKKRAVLTADGRTMKTGGIARANQKRATRSGRRESEPVGTFQNREQDQSVTERIMAALHAHGDLGPAHLSSVSGLSYAEFTLVMDDLIEDGWVEKRIDRGTGLVTFRALAIPESGNERGVDTVDVQAVRRRIIELLLAAADGFDRIGEKVEAHDLRTWANAFKKEWGV